jgi:hypothetical protein
MVRPWGRPRLCARDRSGGLLALAFHSFPESLMSVKIQRENLVWMAAECWGFLPPDQLPASVGVAQYLYEKTAIDSERGDPIAEAQAVGLSRKGRQ